MSANNITSKTFTLNTGAKIPAIGLGTWQSQPGEVGKAVEIALRGGYRHIDTALAYGNEAEVGDGIKASGVPREEIWLTTKLDNPWHKRVTEGIDSSLKSLGTDYVDLYLMHWPSSTDPDDLKKHYPDWDFIKTWHEIQKLPATGKVRNIGVSNFGIKNLEKLLSDPGTTIVPAVNQIELHPNNPSPKLVAYNTSKGIHSTGYSCLGSTNSPLYKDQTLLSMAEAKGKTPQQVLLAWGHEKGWSVIPKSVNKERIEKNFELDGWELTSEEVEKLDNLKDRFKPSRRDAAITMTCPFCSIASNYPTSSSLSNPDLTSPSAFVVLSTPLCMAFLDIMPLSPGHLLVTTRKHNEKISDVSEEEARELGEWLPRLSRVLAKVTGVWDWNIVQNNGAAAAQVVPHVHFHIIPRPGLTPELRNRSFTMFGRGQRSELDEEEAEVLAAQLREELGREMGGTGKGKL
ncbi:glycerol dehydrogenase Gcy1 [Sclerotinia borealis F-4128]|uniref:Glycerol dehydrogenase Gcy1 n=1 Tax=Sclerotinia borealis (strain F-4128) TaxID=1432307 RepID=W9CQY3_SCLBF|nr:glycerol dehydrogenase Gcy1 [Sclerotinia borealis F-4128]